MDASACETYETCDAGNRCTAKNCTNGLCIETGICASGVCALCDDAVAG